MQIQLIIHLEVNSDNFFKNRENNRHTDRFLKFKIVTGYILGIYWTDIKTETEKQTFKQTIGQVHPQAS